MVDKLYIPSIIKYQTVLAKSINQIAQTGLDYTTDVQKDALKQMDLLACSENLCENYFINTCMNKSAATTLTFDVFDVCRLEKSWSCALKSKKVLVVLPFDESVKQQYSKRDKLRKAKYNEIAKRDGNLAAITS